MKKASIILLLSLIVGFTLHAQQSPKTTRVVGKVLDNTSFKEISLRAPSRELTLFDTSRIAADGSFILEFPQLETSIYKIWLADNNQLMMILNPGETVNVTIKASNASDSPKVSGSPETEKLIQGQIQLGEFTKKPEVLNTQWKESMGAPKPDSIQAILRIEYTMITDQQNAFLKDIIAKNKYSLVGLFFIERLDISDDFETYDMYDQAIMQRYPNNSFIKDFHARVEGERRIAVGNMAPDIKLPNADGVEKSLSGLKGKVVLIDFWAAWCGPCRKENPHVVDMYKKYNAKGFEVLGVSLDRDREAWLKAIKDDGLVWTQISDLKYWKSDAAKLYNVTAIPFTVLVDREGKIIGKKLRGEALSEELKKIFGY